MLRRLINGMRVIYYDIKASDRPNRLEEMAIMRRLRRGWMAELVVLDEEHRRLLLAVIFNKHKRPLLEAIKDFWWATSADR